MSDYSPPSYTPRFKAYRALLNDGGMGPDVTELENDFPPGDISISGGNGNYTVASAAGVFTANKTFQNCNSGQTSQAELGLVSFRYTDASNLSLVLASPASPVKMSLEILVYP